MGLEPGCWRPLSPHAAGVPPFGDDPETSPEAASPHRSPKGGCIAEILCSPEIPALDPLRDRPAVRTWAGSAGRPGSDNNPILFDRDAVDEKTCWNQTGRSKSLLHHADSFWKPASEQPQPAAKLSQSQTCTPKHSPEFRSRHRAIYRTVFRTRRVSLGTIGRSCNRQPCCHCWLATAASSWTKAVATKAQTIRRPLRPA